MTNTSGASTLLDVSSTSDMQDMNELVGTEVAANWQTVALRLGVEGCLRRIILKNHPNDCVMTCSTAGWEGIGTLVKKFGRDPHS